MNGVDIAPGASLALEPLLVCHEQPDWRAELLVVLCAILLIGMGMAIATAFSALASVDGASDAAEFWKKRAEKIETTAVVRLEADGNGYQCRQFNIRREWELVVAKKCEELGGLMTFARATR